MFCTGYYDFQMSASVEMNITGESKRSKNWNAKGADAYMYVWIK